MTANVRLVYAKDDESRPRTLNNPESAEGVLANIQGDIIKV